MARNLSAMADQMLARSTRVQAVCEEAIVMGEKYMRSEIPAGWSTYGPAVTVAHRPKGAVALQMTKADLAKAAADLQARGGTIRRRYGLSSRDYIVWDRHSGGKVITDTPYPVRVEAFGAPDDSRNPGAGQGLWSAAAEIVEEAFTSGIRSAAL